MERFARALAFRVSILAIVVGTAGCRPVRSVADPVPPDARRVDADRDGGRPIEKNEVRIGERPDAPPFFVRFAIRGVDVERSDVELYEDWVDYDDDEPPAVPAAPAFLAPEEPTERCDVDTWARDIAAQCGGPRPVVDVTPTMECDPAGEIPVGDPAFAEAVAACPDGCHFRLAFGWYASPGSLPDCSIVEGATLDGALRPTILGFLTLQDASAAVRIVVEGTDYNGLDVHASDTDSERPASITVVHSALAGGQPLNVRGIAALDFALCGSTVQGGHVGAWVAGHLGPGMDVEISDSTFASVGWTFKAETVVDARIERTAFVAGENDASYGMKLLDVAALSIVDSTFAGRLAFVSFAPTVAGSIAASDFKASVAAVRIASETCFVPSPTRELSFSDNVITGPIVVDETVEGVTFDEIDGSAPTIGEWEICTTFY
jgi:hypothetical protein